MQRLLSTSLTLTLALPAWAAPAAHDMAGMAGHGMTMPSSVDLNDPMSRESSGTSWAPDSSPIYARMKMRGQKMLMLHGGVFPRYTRVNSDRDVSASGKGKESRFDAPNMFMAMASRPLGDKAQLGLRAMLSLDPLSERGYGYPLLFQSGESYQGQPLHDRQHPHDLFDELSATYSRRLGQKNSAYLYLGYPGEPALGPPVFMHRVAAMDNPDAPIGHHWQDSTHITFGVATLGVSNGKVKLEGSVFNGSEPNENRTDFDRLRLNSASARLSWNPNPNWALQISRGYLKHPELLEPDINRHRTTASAIYNKPLGEDSNWATSLVWGQNDDSGFGKTNSYLAETNYQRRADTIYARVERVEKPGHELVLAPADEDKTFNVGAYSLGYVRDLKHGSPSGLDVGLGAQVTLNSKPSGLDAYYGSGMPTGFQVFLRIRPSRLKMDAMREGTVEQSMPMENTSGGLQVAAALSPNPPATGQNMLTVTLTDAAGKPVTGAKIESGVAMASMDMGTTHPAFKDLGGGRYSGTVDFSMAGPWRVTLRITPPGGATATKSLDYAVK